MGKSKESFISRSVSFKSDHSPYSRGGRKSRDQYSHHQVRNQNRFADETTFDNHLRCEKTSGAPTIESNILDVSSLNKQTTDWIDGDLEENILYHMENCKSNDVPEFNKYEKIIQRFNKVVGLSQDDNEVMKILMTDDILQLHIISAMECYPREFKNINDIKQKFVKHIENKMRYEKHYQELCDFYPTKYLNKALKQVQRRGSMTKFTGHNHDKIYDDY